MKKLFCLLLLLSFAVQAESFSDWAKQLEQQEQQWTPDHAILARHWQQSITLSDMGLLDGMDIRGDNSSRSLSFGVRQDELVEQFLLDVRYVFSPSLLGRISHVKVYLNGEVVGVLPIDPQRAGTPVSHSIEIPVELVTDYNHLRFQMVGHYTQEYCEDPLHSSIWVQIQSDSALRISRVQLPQASELANFPEPFFDPRDSNKLVLPFELGSAPGLERLRNAALLASWFGVQADWRAVRFPLLQQQRPNRHAVILATHETLPAWLQPQVPPVDGPTIAILSLPLEKPIAVDEENERFLYSNPYVKLLLVLGRNEEELNQAVLGLTTGKAVLSGRAVRIEQVDLGPERQPYDAPRWVRLDRPVKLGELVNDRQQLQVAGHLPETLQMNMRIPADLFTWGNQGVPVELKYRYTPPVSVDDSRLSVRINNEFIEAFILRPEGKGGEKSRVRVPILDEEYLANISEFDIPAFKLGSNNQLQFDFRFGYAKQDLCKRGMDDNILAALDPDSTIDFSDMPHYAAMPNLGFFANSGYPFNRMADLSQTILVLPDQPNAEEKEAVLELVGQMSGHTGYPGFRMQLKKASEITPGTDADLLVIGRAAHETLLQTGEQSLPAGLGQWMRALGLPSRSVTQLYDWLGMETRPDPAVREQVKLLASGQLGMMLGYESPFQSGRSVVAVLGSDSHRLASTVQALGNPAKVARVHGSVALFRGEHVESLLVGDTYMVGDLAWYLRLWYFLLRHPFVLISLALLVAVVSAFLLWKALENLRERRLNPQD